MERDCCVDSSVDAIMRVRVTEAGAPLPGAPVCIIAADTTSPGSCVSADEFSSQDGTVSIRLTLFLSAPFTAAVTAKVTRPGGTAPDTVAAIGFVDFRTGVLDTLSAEIQLP